MGKQPIQVVAVVEEEEGLHLQTVVSEQLSRRVVSRQRRKIVICMLAALILAGLSLYLLINITQDYLPIMQIFPSPTSESVANSSLATDEDQIQAEEEQQSSSEDVQEQSRPAVSIQLAIPNRAIESYLRKRRKIYEQHALHFRKLEADQLAAARRANLSQAQIVQAISLAAAAPLLPTASRNMTALLEEELRYYSSRYDMDHPQLPMCVVVPSYKNMVRFRYFLNLWTILQQNYTNYHVVIIDDASRDGTAEKIAEEVQSHHLEGKVRLVVNEERLGHMVNIYNAVHEHCKEEELLLIIDGDDELIGRQVFQVVNAVYHRDKPLAMYTNHIQAKRDTAIEVGISLPYPDQVRKTQSYRQERHLYSHLRTSWVSLFLLINKTSLQDDQSKWFDNAVDNAIYYCLFQMACEEVQYLPEVTYKYSTFTGHNIDNLQLAHRSATSQLIREKKKYGCLKDTHPELYKKIKGLLTKR